MARRRIVLFVLVVAAAAFIAVRRPWERPQQPPGPPGMDLSKMATLECTVVGGGPCTVRVEGHSGGSLERFTFNLTGVSKSMTQHAPPPLVLDRITVERGGQTLRQEVQLSIAGGQTREIRVHEDDTAEVVTP